MYIHVSPSLPHDQVLSDLGVPVVDVVPRLVRPVVAGQTDLSLLQGTDRVGIHNHCCGGSLSILASINMLLYIYHRKVRYCCAVVGCCVHGTSITEFVCLLSYSTPEGLPSVAVVYRLTSMSLQE